MSELLTTSLCDMVVASLECRHCLSDVVLNDVVLNDVVLSGVVFITSLV